MSSRVSDRLGTAVSVHGTAALVGAHRNDGPGEDSGSAYMFRFDGVDWSQEQKLTAGDGDAGDWFGVSVSLENDVAGEARRRNDRGRPAPIHSS